MHLESTVVLCGNVTTVYGKALAWNINSYEQLHSVSVGEVFERLCYVSSVCIVQSNYTHLLLQGEDRLYLNPEESLSQFPAASRPGSASTSPSAFIGNKQWHVMHLPHNYLLHNWPVRVR